MTSFDIAALIQELDSRLKGSRVSNIYQTNSSVFLLKLHQKGKEDSWLLIEPGRRLHLTSFVIEKPRYPPQFCRNLRKYLRNAVLTSVRQIDFERLVEFTFNIEKTEYRLIIELFSRGNIVLIDPAERILHALHFRRMKDRNIIRGEPFSPPPPSGANPWTMSSSSSDLIRDLGELELVRGLTRVFSIGGQYAEELLLRSNVDKRIPCSSLSQEQFSRILEALETLRESLFLEELNPGIILNPEKTWIDVVPIQLKRYESFEKRSFPTFNEACDEYFIQKAQQDKEREEPEGGKAVNEQLRILTSQRRQLEEQTREAEELKAIGDLIYLHYSELSDVLQKVQTALDLGRDWKEIRGELQSDKSQTALTGVRLGETRSVELALDGKRISLNIDEPLQQNADRYYSQAKKIRRKLSGLKRAIENTQAKIKAVTRDTGLAEPRHKPPRKRRRLRWFEKFRWFHSTDGFLVVGGRDASTNEILIKKHMTPQDLVAHAEVQGAPFVLVKTEGREVSEVTLREACQFAVSTSRAWRLGLGSADAYWVKPDQISSSPPPGQYMAKGMFMVYGPRNHLHSIPLRLAIGVFEEEGVLKLIGGPPSSVSNRTKYYAEIVPGNLSSLKLADEVKSTLKRLLPSEIDSQLMEIPLDEIQRLLPPGKGRVSGAKK